MQLQTGDLIFVGVTDTDDFSQRIAASTHRETAVDYTHIGLVEKTTATLFVLHASPETGSTREPLAKLASPMFTDQQSATHPGQQFYKMPKQCSANPITGPLLNPGLAITALNIL